MWKNTNFEIMEIFKACKLWKLNYKIIWFLIGFTNQKEYDKAWALTKPASPDTARKIAGFLNMVKDRADEKINNLQSTGTIFTNHNFWKSRKSLFLKILKIATFENLKNRNFWKISKLTIFKNLENHNFLKILKITILWKSQKAQFY